MKTGVLLTNNDIKNILSKVFNVKDEDIVQTKYSFMIIGADMDDIKKYVSVSDPKEKTDA